jgi:hypothetical protein
VNRLSYQLGFGCARLCDHQAVPQLRPEEEWARNVIAHALPSAQVSQHDDGSQPAMFDLAISYPDGRTGAAEVTTATDAEQLALWRLIHTDGRWIDNSIQGGWYVEVRPSARGRLLLDRLPAFLRDLEQAGIAELRPFEQSTPLCAINEGRALQIEHAHQSGTNYPGSIYPHIALPLEQRAGFVPETGDALAHWVTNWVNDPVRMDNRTKLASSGANERHLLVIVISFGGVPFAVTDLLWRPDAPLPTRPPQLPPEITHVWVMSTWDAGYCMCYSPSVGWERFDKPDSSVPYCATGKRAGGAP